MDEVKPFSLFTEFDIGLFKMGQHYELYEKLGSRDLAVDGRRGVYFAVWAPNALEVAVVGDFNDWNPDRHVLKIRWDHSGIWEGFIPDLGLGTVYKYAIKTYRKQLLFKADPFALLAEVPPATASIVATTFYEWKDSAWFKKRSEINAPHSPLSIYEVHLPSWCAENDPCGNYRSIAQKLVHYVKRMDFTHIEFLPVMHHPYGPSWGYQITGYFAVNSRLGAPQDLMILIDELHRNDIGVILDWVPAHFPGDAHGLHYFDGSFLFEHEDPRKGFHPEWNSYIFNYGRSEVRAFLISNAIFWLNRYHADGLRVDAVTSMLHLDYARKAGEWEPNKEGTNINLEAEQFLKELNTAVNRYAPNALMIAEDSSQYPDMTASVEDDGLGFDRKWMMGWMHDTLEYFSADISQRSALHHKLTFSSTYIFNEKYVLPLSHDEVVHGKSSLIYKMPGDEWQKFANLRALYVYMFTQPGGKLLFMGDEFGQTSEWASEGNLQWGLLQYLPHLGLQKFVEKLLLLYRTSPALFQNSYSPDGFEWIDADDTENSVYIYQRIAAEPQENLVIVLNLTAKVQPQYRVALPFAGEWSVLLNSDDEEFFGSGAAPAIVKAEKSPYLKQQFSARVALPPLSGLILKKQQ